MKKLMNLNGAKVLSKPEQKAIQGGLGIIVAQNCPGQGGAICPTGCHCNLATEECADSNGNFCVAL